MLKNSVVERIHILVHLLLHAGIQVGINPRRRYICPITGLELSTWRQKRELQNPNTPEVLEEMFKVRQLMERMGTGCNGETIPSDLGI